MSDRIAYDQKPTRYIWNPVTRKIFCHVGRKQTHEHIVSIDGFPSYGKWLDMHHDIIVPWLKENTTGRWAASFTHSMPSFAIHGAATYEFSDLQDAALFRLRF